jgi:sec-independent protein translocase protein TatA
MYLAFLNLGPTEIVLIVIVAILLFGGKLPNVARDAGRWFFQLKRGMTDLNRDIYNTTSFDTPPVSPPITRDSLPLPGSPEEVTPTGAAAEPTLDADYSDGDADYSDEIGGSGEIGDSENADDYHEPPYAEEESHSDEGVPPGEDVPSGYDGEEADSGDDLNRD